MSLTALPAPTPASTAAPPASIAAAAPIAQPAPLNRTAEPHRWADYPALPAATLSTASATWCQHLDVHPLVAQRFLIGA